MITERNIENLFWEMGNTPLHNRETGAILVTTKKVKCFGYEETYFHRNIRAFAKQMQVHSQS